MPVAFKEWALVCEALGRGDQTLILRKGGIAEGRSGFQFQHQDFLLFPTLYHEQVAKLRLPRETPLLTTRANGEVEIRYAAHVEWTRDVTNWEIVQRLAPFHLWEEREIQKRFRQDDTPGVSLAFVRISRLSAPFLFPDSPKYGGCRSWVQIPELPQTITLVPVLDEAAYRRQEAAVRAIIA